MKGKAIEYNGLPPLTVGSYGKIRGVEFTPEVNPLTGVQSWPVPTAPDNTTALKYVYGPTIFIRSLKAALSHLITAGVVRNEVAKKILKFAELFLRDYDPSIHRLPHPAPSLPVVDVYASVYSSRYKSQFWTVYLNNIVLVVRDRAVTPKVPITIHENLQGRDRRIQFAQSNARSSVMVLRMAPSITLVVFPVRRILRVISLGEELLKSKRALFD